MSKKSFFEFFCPVKIVSGFMALSNLPHEMDQLGAKRAMIVTDQGVKGAGLIETVEKAFEGSNCEIGTIYDQTPPDSSNLVVNEVADLFNRNDCDCFVAVGGGSSMDTAKCANIVVTEGTKDLMQFQGADRVNRDLKPFIAVPTTAGTGSEVTLVAVVYNVDANEKMAFTSDKLYPNVAIIDPRMTKTMPPKITAATGMDALTHAIEAYYCLGKNPVSDSLALTAIKLIIGNLVKCVKNGEDEEARLNMANGALIAGMAFSNSMVGMVHSLAHAAGGACHVPHGVANNIFLPFGMEHNLTKRSEIIAELAPYLWGSDVHGNSIVRARAAIDAVRDLSKRLNQICGLPVTLSEAGVTEDKIEEIARLAVNDGSLIYNPEEMKMDEAIDIIKKAM